MAAMQRPVVIVGGELTLDMLDLTYNEASRYSEAPLQLKANGGVLLVDDFGRQLVSPQALLNRWIKSGAPADEKIVALPPHAQVTAADRHYWAFQPPRKAAEPAVRSADRARTSIDRFLLSKLEVQGLGFSPDADRTVLIRRAYLDLIGIPPEPTAVAAFLADTRPDRRARRALSRLSETGIGDSSLYRPARSDKLVAAMDRAVDCDLGRFLAPPSRAIAAVDGAARRTVAAGADARAGTGQ